MGAMHGAVPVPAAERRPRWAAADLRALRALVRAFPLGSRLRFVAYSVVTWPRDWRLAAMRDPVGLHTGDELETVGYGAGQGFPEALQVRRVRDGARHLVFPSDVDADIDAATLPRQLAERRADEERWADDGGRGRPEPRAQSVAAAMRGPHGVREEGR